jgi:hypothetical protein
LPGWATFIDSRRADQLRAAGEIGGVEQAHPVAGRRLHEVGVAQVQRAVGKGQAGRFGVQVQPVGRRGRGRAGVWHTGLQRQRRRLGVRQDAEDLADGDRAGTRGREAAHAVVTAGGR